MRKTYWPLILLIIQSAFEANAQPRYALVIGNGEYKKKDNTLRNPTNDAKLIASKLQLCKFKVDEYENLSNQNFKSAIENFYNKIKGTHCDALFFYSGHGIQHSGENYLIPSDANLTSEADVDEQCIKLQLILNKLQDAGTRTNIVILDACRNDPFSKGWNRGEGEKGLTVVGQTPPQSFIAFATAPDRVATDGNGTNSPYSTSIAKYINVPGITIFQVFQKVYAEVKKANPNQSPWNNYSMDDNDFYFTSKNDFNGTSVRMEILVADDCKLYVDGRNKGQFPGGASFHLDYPSGDYKIRAVSLRDSSIYYDTVYRYNSKNNPGDNLMYIPLNNNSVSYPILDSIKFSMIRIEGAEFTMGSKGGNYDEVPEHKVVLSSFSICKYEVTQRLWVEVMNNNPSINKDCMDCPVENVSWTEVNEFIGRLNDKTREHYRLPTEVEWEFAAVGGLLSNRFMFSGGKDIKKQGWYYGNSGGKSHPIGKKAGNELGVSDMSGNVAEWCSDWYSGSFYGSGRSDNPKGPSGGKEKVIRGGSWDDYDQPCRVFSRNKKDPGAKDKTIGFRLAK